MKISHYFSLFFPLLFVVGIADAHKKHGHHHEPPVVTEITNVTNVTEINNFGITDNEFNGSMAAAMAADAIHCTTSSRKHQMGIGTGWSDGANGIAIGYCHSIEIQNQPVMIGIKASGADNTDAKYSVGFNWTF
jgi:hypothetical protein